MAQTMYLSAPFLVRGLPDHLLSQQLSERKGRQVITAAYVLGMPVCI